MVDIMNTNFEPNFVVYFVRFINTDYRKFGRYNRAQRVNIA